MRFDLLRDFPSLHAKYYHGSSKSGAKKNQCTILDNRCQKHGTSKWIPWTSPWGVHDTQKMTSRESVIMYHEHMVHFLIASVLGLCQFQRCDAFTHCNSVPLALTSSMCRPITSTQLPLTGYILNGFKCLISWQSQRTITDKHYLSMMPSNIVYIENNAKLNEWKLKQQTQKKRNGQSRHNALPLSKQYSALLHSFSAFFGCISVCAIGAIVSKALPQNAFSLTLQNT